MGHHKDSSDATSELVGQHQICLQSTQYKKEHAKHCLRLPCAFHCLDSALGPLGPYYVLQTQGGKRFAAFDLRVARRVALRARVVLRDVGLGLAFALALGPAGRKIGKATDSMCRGVILLTWFRNSSTRCPGKSPVVGLHTAHNLGCLDEIDT